MSFKDEQIEPQAKGSHMLITVIEGLIMALIDTDYKKCITL